MNSLTELEHHFILELLRSTDVVVEKLDIYSQQVETAEMLNLLQQIQHEHLRVRDRLISLGQPLEHSYAYTGQPGGGWVTGQPASDREHNRQDGRQGYAGYLPDVPAAFEMSTETYGPIFGEHELPVRSDNAELSPVAGADPAAPSPRSEVESPATDDARDRGRPRRYAVAPEKPDEPAERRGSQPGSHDRGKAESASEHR
ncbi:MAG: hypothetical protein WD535_00080 [Thermaerobacterales bacterium]